MQLDEQQRMTTVLEMSALKVDDAASNRELLALNHATEKAAFTIICGAGPLAAAFAFRTLSEFRTALCDVQTNRRQLTHDRVVGVEPSPADWIALYSDANCVRMFGRGQFAAFFADSAGNVGVAGGAPSNTPFDVTHSLARQSKFALLISTNAHADNSNRMRCLMEAACTQPCTTDSLALAYVSLLVKESGFCVFTLLARRVSGEAKPPGSPKKSELRVLDSGTDCMPMQRHSMEVSTDGIEGD